EVCAMLRRPRHQSYHGAVGVDESIARTETSAHNVIGTQLRKHALDFIRGNQAHVLQSHGNLLLIVRTQIPHVLITSSAKQIALWTVAGRMSQSLLEAGIKGNRVKRHLNVNWRGKLAAHSAHTLAGGSLAQMRFALDDGYVCTTGGGKVP